MRILFYTPEEHHGVVQHAKQVAGLVAGAGVEAVRGGPADLAHAQFTDALWGSTIDQAATAYERWAGSTPSPIVVTLHDVPGSDPDGARDARRRAGYARVVAASDEAIVSSQHEAVKVIRLSGRRPRFIELPMPVFGPAPLDQPTTFDWAQGTTLGLLGFLYPGKGHADAIAAAARQSPVPRVVSLGAVSPGHDGLHDELRVSAARCGVEFVVTGALADSALAAAAAVVTVPLAPNRLVSASASLIAWIGYQRRPVAARSPYSLEIWTRHPGQIQLYEGLEVLDSLIGAAIPEPGRTRLAAVPHWNDVGAQHVAVYRDVLHASRMSRAGG